MENTEAIASYDPFCHPLIFPDYPTDDPASELRKRVLSGAEIRYGELNDAILSRIDYELAIIEEKGFSAYFLVMHDIVQMSSRTCGRGSGAASIVSYSLFITAVDPLAHHLYFERFLSPARTDPPDIDVDFAWDERDAVFAAVYAAFGVDHCARVANHLFFRPDSALRETAKAHGLSDAQISAVTRSLHTPSTTHCGSHRRDGRSSSTCRRGSRCTAGGSSSPRGPSRSTPPSPAQMMDSRSSSGRRRGPRRPDL